VAGVLRRASSASLHETFNFLRQLIAIRMPKSKGKQKGTAAAASAESAEFDVGCRVRVVGLVQAAHHNGKTGVVISSSDTQTGRIGVELEDGAEVLIKPCNMQLLQHPYDAYPPLAAAAVSGVRRTKPHCIDDLVAQPAFLFGFQTGLKQLQSIFPSRFRFCFERNPLGAMPLWLSRANRLLLIAKGRLRTMLAQRLLCAPGHFAGDRLRLGSFMLSGVHVFHNSSVACVATLNKHRGPVTSVAFHETAPLLATGSLDKTARLWQLSSDNSSATCVATVAGHINPVTSVACHPTAPLLATGSEDDTLFGHSHTSKLWRLMPDNSSATCVATLEGNRRDPRHAEHVWCLSAFHGTKAEGTVTSVAFHPTAPLLVTGSKDNTVKLWRLSSDNSSATCVATLEGHRNDVTSVAFHATAPLLATGSKDNTAKLWRLSSDNSSATCVATLEGHRNDVTSVAFHATAPLLATGSLDKTAKLWRLSPDNSSATCVDTLELHISIRNMNKWYCTTSTGVTSVAFHPTAPLLATGSKDNTVKLWRLSSDNSSATCVATLEGHSGPVTSVAFHATASLLAAGSEDNTVTLWR
jgi:WD40 repeat protein